MKGTACSERNRPCKEIPLGSTPASIYLEN